MKLITPITVGDSLSYDRNGSAHYWDSSGVLQTASSDVPRVSYEFGVGEPPIILDEPAALNLLGYPRNFDKSVFWAKIRATIIPNSALAPNNTFTADKLVEDTNPNNHFCHSTRTGSNEVMTGSILVKAAERTRIRLEFSNFVSASGGAMFDLATGSVVSVDSDNADYSGMQARIEATPFTGWYRCILTAQKGSVNTTNNFVVLLANSSSNTNYTGDGQSGVYIWHAQLEAGSEATSIIIDSTSFTNRTTIKNEFNSSGVLTEYAISEAVTSYDPVSLVSRGLSLEDASTNSIRNSTAAGAVAGTPGTTPSNWLLAYPVGITPQIVGTGTEDGIEYMDVRYYGTAATTGNCAVYFETSTGIIALQNQVWSSSVFVDLKAGSFTGFYSTQPFSVHDYITIGVVYSSGTVQVQPVPTLNNGLRKGRISHTRTITDAATQYVRPYYAFGQVNAGSTIDVTLRLGLPQMENITSTLVGPTSPIKTSSVAVTRAADTSPAYTLQSRAADTFSAGRSTLISNVPENDYTLWNSGTSYSIGNYVRYVSFDVHNIYRAITANTNQNPTSNADDWLLVGVTNPFRMFDTSVQSQSTVATSIQASILLRDVVTSIGLLNIAGNSVRVSLTHPIDGVVYDETVDVTSTSGVVDWYTYFFQPYVRKTDILFENIPPYGDGTLTITITEDGTAACGAAILGSIVDISADKLGVDSGAKVGIQDYSIKQRDEFGNYTILERAFNKRADFTVYMEPSDVDGVLNILASRRATPTLYIGSNQYTATMIYGFYKDFSIDLAYPCYSVCSLQIEGLT